MLAILLSGIAQGQNRQTPSLVVRLPREVDPESTILHVDKTGSNVFFQDIRMQRGIFEYPIPFRFGNAPSALQADDFKSLHLLIYSPGYRVIEKTFLPDDVTTPRVYETPLTKLPTVHFEGLLVDSGNLPIPRQSISLRYLRNPSNCPDCILSEWKIGSTSTEAAGKFQFEIPNLADDPFFGTTDRGYFSFLNVGPGYLNPNSFAIQNIPKTQIVVKRTLPGKLKGKIGNAFLQKYQLPANLSKFHDYDKKNYVELSIDFDKGSYYHETRDDGSFEIDLIPNTYSLSIRIVRGFQNVLIKIQDNILIEENKSTVVQIP